MANIVVDPKGHDPVQLEQDIAECRALGGALVKNKAKRVDSSVEDAKIKEAQRNCLYGRGYVPMS